MFGRRNISFFIGLGIVAILIVIILILVFAGGGTPSPTPQPIASYANDPTAQASMLIDGPTSADSTHNQVLVTVTNSNVTAQLLSGYNGTVKDSKSYVNNPAAFHVFLRSLEFAGFTKGNNDPSLSQAAGYCPLGDRYIFSFDDSGSQLERYWTTSCSGGTKTYYGNFDMTWQLFRAQVPDYDSLTSGANL